MTNLTTTNGADILEKVIISGDLANLKPAQRVEYYAKVCESVGLNPLTQPFAYIKLNGKLTLYAKRDCADQLRKIHGISIEKPDIDMSGGLIVVTVTARDKTGRTDADLGAVALGQLQGEAKANAILKAVTKAKRRVTLSLAGLGWLDETEVESIPTAEPVPPPAPLTPPLKPQTNAEAEQAGQDFIDNPEGDSKADKALEADFEEVPAVPTPQEVKALEAQAGFQAKAHLDNARAKHLGDNPDAAAVSRYVDYLTAKIEAKAEAEGKALEAAA